MSKISQETCERTLNSIRDLHYTMLKLTNDKEVHRLLEKSLKEIEDALLGPVKP